MPASRSASRCSAACSRRPALPFCSCRHSMWSLQRFEEWQQLAQDGKVGSARAPRLNRRCSLRRSPQRLAHSSARRHPGDIEAWLATRQSTILPPPAGTPLQNCICSALQMLRISSRNLTGSGPIGPICGSATGGGAAAASYGSRPLRHRERRARSGSRRKAQAHGLAGIAGPARRPAGRPRSGT